MKLQIRELGISNIIFQVEENESSSSGVNRQKKVLEEIAAPRWTSGVGISDTIEPHADRHSSNAEGDRDAHNAKRPQSSQRRETTANTNGRRSQQTQATGLRRKLTAALRKTGDKLRKTIRRRFGLPML